MLKELFLSSTDFTVAILKIAQISKHFRLCPSPRNQSLRCGVESVHVRPLLVSLKKPIGNIISLFEKAIYTFHDSKHCHYYLPKSIQLWDRKCSKMKKSISTVKALINVKFDMLGRLYFSSEIGQNKKPFLDVF